MKPRAIPASHQPTSPGDLHGLQGPPDGLTDRTLRPIREVNAQFFELLHRCAAATPVPGMHAVPEVVWRWIRQATAAMRSRAADSLFLLVDFEFQNARWWSSARPSDASDRRDSWLAGIPRKWAVEVAQAALTLAWHTARSQAPASRLLIGLGPAVADALEDLSPLALHRIARTQIHHLQPRWTRHPQLWNRLLCVAEGHSRATWRDFHLEALQYLARDLDHGSETQCVKKRN